MTDKRNKTTTDEKVDWLIANKNLWEGKGDLWGTQELNKLATRMKNLGFYSINTVNSDVRRAVHGNIKRAKDKMKLGTWRRLQ